MRQNPLLFGLMALALDAAARAAAQNAAEPEAEPICSPAVTADCELPFAYAFPARFSLN
jgi:hypothetical protein